MKLPVSTLLVYALVFCTELGQSMLFPLLPMFADEFALSDAQTGAILAASTLATVAAALPAGLLAARRGARFVCVLAGDGDRALGRRPGARPDLRRPAARPRPLRRRLRLRVDARA